MTIHEFDEWLIKQARTMPRAMNKGGTSEAQQNIKTANADNAQLFQQGQQEQAQVLPFLNSEMTNPAGFGTQGTNELMTAGGEATSGAVGNATEQANLRASRTGNPSDSASIIDAAARAGGQQQSTNALDVNKANMQEKLAQQQAGASGISAMGAGNIGESLSALGLSNQAIQDYMKAYTDNNSFGAIMSDIGGVGKAATGVATGISGVQSL